MTYDLFIGDRAFSSWSLRGWLLLSSALVTVNWLLYVWAVMEGHIVAGSLGYFISPLLSVLSSA